MTIEIPGLHHVTSIASNPQQNVDFYTEVLGLRLVKRTVNFDDKYTYHLYYGDEVGNPGTVLTFFPFEDGRQGRVGRGQTSATAFVIPEGQSTTGSTGSNREMSTSTHRIPGSARRSSRSAITTSSRWSL